MTAPSIPTRMYATERDLARHDIELVDHERRINTVEKHVAIVAVRIGIYATLGATIGGGLVAGIVAVLSHNHF